MNKLHLNFYELSEEVKNELKKSVLFQYSQRLENESMKSSHSNPVSSEFVNRSVDELFEENNAGIDIDIYNYMSY